MKSKTRKITIESNTYIWSISNNIKHIAEIKQYVAEALFSAYYITNKRNPLRIAFTTWDDPVMGNPLYTGWKTTRYSKEEVVVNLNYPGIARELINAARNKGWSPEKDNNQMMIIDGLHLLTEIGYDIEGLRLHS